MRLPREFLALYYEEEVLEERQDIAKDITIGLTCVWLSQK